MVKAKLEKTVVVRQDEEVVLQSPISRQDEHERQGKVKHGEQRLDKRSAKGVSGQPKKSGQGGKYTWGGSGSDWSSEDSPSALDKNDPNYVDEDDDFEKSAPSRVVELGKSESIPQEVVAQ